MYYSTIATPAHSTSTRGWLVSGLLFPVCALYLLNPGILMVLDAASGLMYEVGRFTFSYVGGMAIYVGGTVGQLFLPVLLAWYFYNTRYMFALQALLFWLGQNLINISLHIAKPNYMYAHHYGHSDWQKLLVFLDIGSYDLYAGTIVFAAGSICFMLSLLVPGLIRR
jgi:hypothetical protein